MQRLGEIDLESTEDLLVSDSGGMTYVGTAAVGSLSSQAVWKIFRFNNSTGRLSYASSDYDQVWDDRESLTYV